MDISAKKKIAWAAIVCSCIFFFCVTIKLLFDMTFYETLQEKRQELYETAERINMRVRNQISSLKLIFMDVEISRDNAGNVRGALQKIQSVGCFKGIVYDLSGNVAAAIDFEGERENAVYDLRAFQSAMNGVDAISEPRLDEAEDHSYIVFYVPILDQESKVKGVLAAYVYIESLDSLVNEFFYEEAQYYIIIDANGSILNRQYRQGQMKSMDTERLISTLHEPIYPNAFLLNIAKNGFHDVLLGLNLEYSSYKLVKGVSAEKFCQEIFSAEVPYLALIAAGYVIFLLAALFIYRERSRRRLEEKMQMERLLSATQVAAGIGHEIKNPLTSMKGFMQIMLRREQEQSSREYLTIMLCEVERIELLVSQFSMLARPVGKEVYARFDLTAVVLQTLDIASPHAKAHDIELKFDAPPEKSLTLYGNANQVKQVLLNLLKNAIEASSAHNLVEVALWRRERQCFVRVLDHGCGIPPDIQGKIGSPFFTTKEKGTGLGMMISYEIIRRHHGEITVDSSVGKGTSFQVCLPLLESEKNADQAEDFRAG